VAEGCGGSGCNVIEREREHERETRNECAAQGVRSRGGCNGRRWSIDGGRRVWWQWLQRRERGERVAEAHARGRRRVREIRTLNKPYGFGC